MRILIIRHGDPDYERDTLTEKGIRGICMWAENNPPFSRGFAKCTATARGKIDLGE